MWVYILSTRVRRAYFVASGRPVSFSVCANVCLTFWRGVRLYQRGFECVCVGWREAIQGREIELCRQISPSA